MSYIPHSPETTVVCMTLHKQMKVHRGSDILAYGSVLELISVGSRTSPENAYLIIECFHRCSLLGLCIMLMHQC